MSLSVLAATIHNPTDLGARSEPELMGRDIAAMVLERRQDDNNTPDSPEVEQLKKERDAISPELTKARQGVTDAKKKIPQDVKDAIKAAQKNFKTTKDGLDQPTKDKLKEANDKIKAAKKAEKKGAAPSPDDEAPTAEAPVAEAPAAEAPAPAPAA